MAVRVCSNCGRALARSADPATSGTSQRVAPGATFSGIVSGGNALTSAISTVLELTSGASTGTIAGFDSKYVGLREIALDSGATWSVSGSVQSAQSVSFSGAHTTLTLANPGSMAGEKLDLTKQAADATAEALPPSDEIAVVVFDSQSQPVVRLQRAANRQRIANDIGRIQASGGTNILAGLRDWMGQHNAVIMAVICLIIGAKLIGDAIGGFGS